MKNNYDDYLNLMFDKGIMADLKGKKQEENPSLENVDELADYLINYVKRHYTIYEYYVSPNISNFYSKHRKFTRFILICLSLFDSESNINTLLKNINLMKIRYGKSNILFLKIRTLINLIKKF